MDTLRVEINELVDISPNCLACHIKIGKDSKELSIDQILFKISNYLEWYKVVIIEAEDIMTQPLVSLFTLVDSIRYKFNKCVWLTTKNYDIPEGLLDHFDLVGEVEK